MSRCNKAFDQPTTVISWRLVEGILLFAREVKSADKFRRDLIVFWAERMGESYKKTMLKHQDKYRYRFNQALIIEEFL